MKFVVVANSAGARRAINPDAVKYLMDAQHGGTAIVFAAFTGGLDVVQVGLPLEEVIELLEQPSSRSLAPRGRASKAS